MPQYTFENKQTGKQKTETMTIAAMEEYLAANPNWFVVIQPIGVRDNFVAGSKTNFVHDNDFRQILKNIDKAAGKYSTMQGNY